MNTDVTDDQILRMYGRGLSMYRTSKKLGVPMDRVRRVIMNNNAGRMTISDQSYLNYCERINLISPGRKKP